MRAAEANGLTRPCALQTWYNLVERPKLEGELRDTALSHGLGIVPFYGLANGFLTGSWAPQIPVFLTRLDISKFTLGLFWMLMNKSLPIGRMNLLRILRNLKINRRRANNGTLFEPL